MSFDFAKYKKEQEKQENNPTLMMLLSGPQGGGKSYAAGTFGCDTLYLHGGSEDHGPDSARMANTKIKKGKGQITDLSWAGMEPDEAYKWLVGVLTDPELPKHFGAVVIDSLTDLTFHLIRDTTAFFEFCKTTKGEHNSWKEGEAIIHLMKPIVKALVNLRKKKVHSLVTMLLDVEQMGAHGEVSLARPYLPTFSVVTGLIPQFRDIAVISYASPLIKGETKDDHYFQFKVNMRRNTSEKSVNQKVYQINPRLMGVDYKDLPEYAKIDLEILADHKAKCMGVKR